MAIMTNSDNDNNEQNVTESAEGKGNVLAAFVLFEDANMDWTRFRKNLEDDWDITFEDEIKDNAVVFSVDDMTVACSLMPSPVPNNEAEEAARRNILWKDGAKVVAKADPEERVGVLCLEDGRPSIVEYYEMTDEMIHRREADGTLSYNYGVILNYLFRVDKLNQTLSVKLPLHRAFKKIPYMAANGEFVKPEEPNAYKFETLALDMVKLQDDCLAYEVDRSSEFAPVKNKTGVDSVDTARELLRLNGVQL